MTRADPIRAALEQPPAEGEGLSDEELWEMYDEHTGEAGDWAWVRDYARAAIALDRSRRSPAPPAEGEVAEVVRWLRSRAGIPASPDFPAVAAYLTRAAELLQQQHPTPVPVSERLPGEGDCDAEGRCWIHMPDIGTAPSWRLVDPREIGPYHTHWAAAHTLPLPQGEVEP